MVCSFQQIALAGIAVALVSGVIGFLMPSPERQAPGSEPGRAGKRRWLAGAVGVVALLAFLALAVSGFYAPLLGLERMTGFLLLAHVGAGGAFAVALAALAAFCAEPFRIGACDCRSASASRFSCGQKAVWWAIVALGLAALLSVLLSMTPLFGDQGQAALYEIHRYSALALTIAATGFVGLAARNLRKSA